MKTLQDLEQEWDEVQAALKQLNDQWWSNPPQIGRKEYIQRDAELVQRRDGLQTAAAELLQQQR